MKKSSIPEEILGVAKPVGNGKLELEPVVTATHTLKAELETEKIKPASILKLISDHEKITLGACDGKATIAQAEKVFNGHIDPAFKNLDLDKLGKKTGPVNIAVHELQKNANLKQMFNQLNPDMNTLCLTQTQIIKFVERHSNWLCQESHATFFLFKCNNTFFVADVFFSSPNMLVVIAIQLDTSNFKWKADDHHRLIVPQSQTVC